MLSIRGGCIMNDINKKGLSTTLLCCLIWGLLPLYWALLNEVSSFSVLSHRIIWSGVWMIFIILAMGRQQLRIDIQHLRTHLSQFGLLLLAAALLASTGSLIFGLLPTNTFSILASGIISTLSSTYCSASLSTKKPCYGPKN